MADADFDAFLSAFVRSREWLPEPLARHYARLYGTRAQQLIDNAASLADMGEHFGGLLYERELAYLREHEWAENGEDVLERRTKQGLHLDADEKGKSERLDGWGFAMSSTSELHALRRLSAGIGSDSALTQAAGGNTSLKEDGVMWIKASGTWLAPRQGA